MDLEQLKLSPRFSDTWETSYQGTWQRTSEDQNLRFRTLRDSRLSRRLSSSCDEVSWCEQLQIFKLRRSVLVWTVADVQVATKCLGVNSCRYSSCDEVSWCEQLQIFKLRRSVLVWTVADVQVATKCLGVNSCRCSSCDEVSWCEQLQIFKSVTVYATWMFSNIKMNSSLHYVPEDLTPLNRDK
jgi:hypothetical protein